MAASRQPALVKDVVALMEQWAPAWTAEAWDRVGLATGHPEAPARDIWVALELTDQLLEAALAAQVQMLLLHHPPLFQPLTDLRADRPATARLLRAAGAGLAIFSAHTNLDAAPGGVNDALAGRLELTGLTPLVPAGRGGLAKLVTFVPSNHLDEVSRALFAAGAGHIGAYRECAFMHFGTGTFLAPAGGNPYLGRAGQRERVEEVRLETLIPQALAEAAFKALRAAHPYEEPAADLYPLLNPPAGCGLGRVGQLAQPMPGARFLAWAAARLGAAAPAFAGPVPEMVERVAVLGGSGGDMLAAAAGAGAQVLVTGEARHHAAQEAQDLGLGLLTLGHYETEVVVVKPWAARLAQDLATANLEAQVLPWTASASPWQAVPVFKED